MSTSALQRIDERRLEKDLGYRFGYLTEFMGFRTEDIAVIHDMAAHLAPAMPALVDAIYDHLFKYDAKLVGFLDFVGKIHTPKAGNKDIEVPLVQMNALMGFVSDALLATIAGLDVDEETKTKALRAFNKLLWLQNDLIVRHYAA